MMDARALTKSLSGMWCGSYGLVRCPAHDDRKPSLSLRDGERGLVVNCFAGCDWQVVKAELKRRGLIEEASTQAPRVSAPRRVKPQKPDADQARRIDNASRLWQTSVPLSGTLGWRYFTERRGLHIGALELDHALRWHQGIGAIVALMTDPATNKPCGVHRTFLNPDGSKRERKMLGRAGVIRLSPDADVTHGLGIAEGIEDGLSVLLSGWSPVWAATSCGAIDRLPVLAGIEHLTIFADADVAGIKAAGTCAARWCEAGRETAILPPIENAP